MKKELKKILGLITLSVFMLGFISQTGEDNYLFKGKNNNKEIEYSSFEKEYISSLFLNSNIKDPFDITKEFSKKKTKKEIKKTSFETDLKKQIKEVEKSKIPSKYNHSDYQVVAWMMKSYEGYHPNAYWDVSQWSIGWGTKSFKGESINLLESNKRHSNEFNRVYKNIKTIYPNLDKRTQLIVASFDYNIGKIGKGMHRALKSGDKKNIAKWLHKYNKSSKGEKLDGLIKRRASEAELLLASENEIKWQNLGEKYRKKVILKIQKGKKYEK